MMHISAIQTQNFDQNQFPTFIAALSAVASQTSPGDCTDDVMGAVSAALSGIIRNKSPIWVFTDALPRDYTGTITVLNQNANRKFPVS